jgi:hypothetical protein
MAFSTPNFLQLPIEQREQIMQAVDRLCINNPNVAKQLTKAVEIKENSPVKWAMVSKALNT